MKRLKVLSGWSPNKPDKHSLVRRWLALTALAAEYVAVTCSSPAVVVTARLAAWSIRCMLWAVER